MRGQPQPPPLDGAPSCAAAPGGSAASSASVRKCSALRNRVHRCPPLAKKPTLLRATRLPFLPPTISRRTSQAGETRRCEPMTCTSARPVRARYRETRAGTVRRRPSGRRRRPRSRRRSPPCSGLIGAAERQQPERGLPGAAGAPQRTQAGRRRRGQPPPDAMPLPGCAQVGAVSLQARGRNGRVRGLPGQPPGEPFCHRTGCRRSGTVYRRPPRDAAPWRTHAAPRPARPRIRARWPRSPRRTRPSRRAGCATLAPAAPSRRSDPDHARHAAASAGRCRSRPRSSPVPASARASSPVPHPRSSTRSPGRT